MMGILMNLTYPNMLLKFHRTSLLHDDMRVSLCSLDLSRLAIFLAFLTFIDALYSTKLRDTLIRPE